MRSWGFRPKSGPGRPDFHRFDRDPGGLTPEEGTPTPTLPKRTSGVVEDPDRPLLQCHRPSLLYLLIFVETE